MSHTIALSQQVVLEGDADGNLSAVRRAATAAKAAGAELLVLPELVVDGAAASQPGPNEPEAARRLHRLCEIAAEAELDVVVGSMRQPVAGSWQSLCHYIGLDGRILGSHAKSQLWWGEREQVAAGDGTAVVVEGRVGPVGLAVCWELTSAATIAALAEAGAQLVVAGGYWPTQVEGPESRHNRRIESQVIDALCLARAFENAIGVAFCNAAGAAPPRHGHRRVLAGHSQLAMPLQGVVSRVDGHHEQLLVANFDADVLTEARAVYGLGAAPRTTFAGS